MVTEECDERVGRAEIVTGWNGKDLDSQDREQLSVDPKNEASVSLGSFYRAFLSGMYLPLLLVPRPGSLIAFGPESCANRHCLAIDSKKKKT